MEQNDKQVDIVNDLIRINNDRVAGYEKAMNELKDEDQDLRSLFSSMAEESLTYRSELTELVNDLGGEVAEGTTGSGKLYRAWMDVKTFFSGGDRETVISNCEAGEDAAQKAYQEALNEDYLSAEVRDIISEQKTELLESHDKMKALKEAHS